MEARLIITTLSNIARKDFSGELDLKGLQKVLNELIEEKITERMFKELEILDVKNLKVVKKEVDALIEQLPSEADQLN